MSKVKYQVITDHKAVRRVWGFGQKSEVIVDLVSSDDQERVLEALKHKTQKFNEIENVNLEILKGE